MRIIEQFWESINEARGELFFDGMSSPLADRTRRIIAGNGAIAVEVLQQTLNVCHIEIESVEEILRQVGLLQDAQTHQARLKLLTAMMKSPQERIRDAASLGLSFLEDPAALPYLHAARQVEARPWLITNLDLVIKQLEQTGCRDT